MWLSVLQTLAALGQLAGIRLLTGILPPSVFGQFSLLMGIVALISAAIANPTMQAMLRYYPEYALQGQGELVKMVGTSQLIKLMFWVLPLGIVGIVASLVYGWSNVIEILFLIGLIFVEIVRMQSVALLNANSAHRLYGIWALTEAWVRPLLAWALMKIMGIHLVFILASYLLASLCTWIVMRRFIPNQKNEPVPLVQKSILTTRFWHYTLPLLPLGLLGWVSGMADRFMIGALLSPADVGFYVAIYGLASRPMLMFGSIIENLIRPAYQSAVSQADTNSAKTYLYRWILFVVLGSLIALVLALTCHHWLACMMLGENYRQASNLLPWLVAGYALLVLSHVANRICYAHEATRRIFLIETSGAFLAVALGLPLIKWNGLTGAAQAVLLYYGAQFVISWLFARPWWPQPTLPGCDKKPCKRFFLTL